MVFFPVFLTSLFSSNIGRESGTILGPRQSAQRAIMTIFHRILFAAAKRIAMDERVQKKVVEVYRSEVKPLATKAWDQAKPKLDAAKTELLEAARESDPQEHPLEFATKLKDRMVERLKKP